MDKVNHSSYVMSVASPRGGCACKQQQMSGVGDSIKDNAWVIAAGASALFLTLALLRRKK